MLEIHSDGARDAYENMQIDRDLFLKRSSHPILRLYTFSSFCATIGIFTPRHGLIREEIAIATRPTGGGLLFHEHDLSYSFYLPESEQEISPVDLCKAINETILKALESFLGLQFLKVNRDFSLRSSFCFASVTPFDLIWRGEKVGGGAQRRSKYGTLHQGSIFLKKPNWDKIGTLLFREADLEQMSKMIVPIEHLTKQPLPEEIVRESIIREFQIVYGKK